MSLVTKHQMVTAQCVLLVVVIFGYDKVYSQDTACGAVGHSDQTEYSRLTDLRFYLNTQTPAPCSGNVTTWEYCYYSPDVRAGEYRAPFGIYRLNGSKYELVSQMFLILISNNDIGSSSFTCRTFTTPVTTIQQGDVVGTCVHDVIRVPIFGGSRAQLNLAGGSANGYSVQFADTSNERCNTDVDVSIPDSVSQGDLSSLSSTILHLHTNITAVSSATTTEQPTMEATTETLTTVEMTTEPPTTMSQPMVTTLSPTTTTESTTDTPTTTESITETPTTMSSTTISVTTDSITLVSTTDQTTSLSSRDDTTVASQSTATEGPETTNTATIITTNTEPSPTTSDTTPTEITLTESDTESSTSSPTSTTAEDVTTPTVTTTDNTVAPSVIGDTGDTNIAPILGSVVGVFLLLVLLTATGSILCLVLNKKKKFRSIYNVRLGSRANSPGFDNVGYLPYGGKDPSLTSEQANGSYHHYDLAGAEKMDSFIYSGSYDEVMSSTSEHQQNTSISKRGLLFTNPYAQVMDEPDDKTRTLSYLKPYDEVMSGAASPLDGSVVSYAELLEKNERDDTHDDSNPYCVPPELEEDIYGQIRTCGAADIPRSAVVSSSYLGSGQFGRVEQGSWLRPGNVQIPVAIKTLNEGSSKQDKVKFLQEAAIMAQFRHPNVITLHGVVRQGEPIMLIVELARKGDLRQHLSTLKPDPGVLSSTNLPVILLNMSQQVALGMQYLSNKGFVHRDLAARNILVSEKMICKIADFGMSRDLADDTYYVAHGGKIPVKWTAPEAINFKKYSTASDIWSYGCLLYEIWSFGEKPFNTFGNLQVVRMVDMGYRLPPPPGCPLRMYDLMINCWHPVASSRPKFLNVCTILAENEKTILEIPEEALKSDPLAGVLGAPLKAGEHMYQDLQKIYYTEESGSYEHIT